MKRLRLLQTLRGDGPWRNTVAHPRIYEQHEISANPLGAISVLAANGRWLGVKPAEMEWLEETEVTVSSPGDLIRRKASAFDALAEATGPEFDNHVAVSIIRAACAGRDLLEVVESALGGSKKALGAAEEKR